MIIIVTFARLRINWDYHNICNYNFHRCCQRHLWASYCYHCQCHHHNHHNCQVQNDLDDNENLPYLGNRQKQWSQVSQDVAPPSIQIFRTFWLRMILHFISRWKLSIIVIMILMITIMVSQPRTKIKMLFVSNKYEEPATSWPMPVSQPVTRTVRPFGSWRARQSRPRTTHRRKPAKQNVEESWKFKWRGTTFLPSCYVVSSLLFFVMRVAIALRQVTVAFKSFKCLANIHSSPTNDASIQDSHASMLAIELLSWWDTKSDHKVSLYHLEHPKDGADDARSNKMWTTKVRRHDRLIWPSPRHLFLDFVIIARFVQGVHWAVR